MIFGFSVLGVIFIVAIASWLFSNEDPYDYIIDYDLSEH